jgi:hypothetical protein
MRRPFDSALTAVAGAPRRDRRLRARRTRWIAVAAVFAALSLACGGFTAQGGGRFDADLRVRMEQEDRELGEGYTATYRHRVTIGLGGLQSDTAYSESSWEGFETCHDPPLEIDFESEIVFDAFRYSEADLYALRRGSEVWLLYEPAREFGVEHPGRPACDSGDAIQPGTRVAKSFFHADLQDGAQPAPDFPVYHYDDEESFGGFVLAVIPLSELQSGTTGPLTTVYEAEMEIFDIRLSVEAVVTPR